MAQLLVVRRIESANRPILDFLCEQDIHPHVSLHYSATPLSGLVGRDIPDNNGCDMPVACVGYSYALFSFLHMALGKNRTQKGYSLRVVGRIYIAHWCMYRFDIIFYQTPIIAKFLVFYQFQFGSESPLTMRHGLHRSNETPSRPVASFRSAYRIRQT